MKKLYALFLTMALLIVTCVPVYASETSPISTSGTGSMLVTATLQSGYYIQVPSTIDLTRDNSTGHYNATYNVGVKGTLSDEKEVRVALGTLELKNGTDTVTLTDGSGITQEIKKWRRTAQSGTAAECKADAYTTTSGTIDAVLSKEGAYSGTLVFTFTLNNITDP